MYKHDGKKRVKQGITARILLRRQDVEPETTTPEPVGVEITTQPGPLPITPFAA